MLNQVGLNADAEDCAITAISETQSLLTNLDIVTPIHDDPYIMGKIAAVNVTNDIYALNALHILNYSCFLGLPTDLPPKFAQDMLRGTRDLLKSLGSDIAGGHTIQNPWPLLGGSVDAIAQTEHLIQKRGIKTGDHLILTKPLGIHPVMAADRAQKADTSWMKDYDTSKIDRAISIATKIMTTSNKPIPEIIHSGRFFEGIHAMTDITGFGFKGHLEEMFLNTNMGARITQLPVISYALQLDDLFCYGLAEGESSEIAGPMLIAVGLDVWDDFTTMMTSSNVWWMEIGVIEAGLNGVKFDEKIIYREIEDY
ncbi:MAG: selenide, water dikinase SelD [Promethearchaeia archaeon]|nr:MAG: selenide, water dikinase SelD [Candidatus Lokiarchaeia archaeon]